jgi:cbb3-type cytochrome oxidase subunit 1
MLAGSTHSTFAPMLSNRFIHTAVVFFVVGVALGSAMGATQDFRLMHVHAHVNLLGWVALGLAGLLYAVHPHLARGWLAHAHYWLHTIGLVVFMGAYAWGVLGGHKPVAAIAAGALSVSAGVLLFALNVFVRLRAPGGAAPRP